MERIRGMTECRSRDAGGVHMSGGCHYVKQTSDLKGLAQVMHTERRKRKEISKDNVNRQMKPGKWR
ncbi:MAG: hypothetical protein CMF77_00055 [Candidatus Marinimicrobia bacterium]|nr:hypothetical protein [Candidatus Neomarinimicrobiota bacterium]